MHTELLCRLGGEVLPLRIGDKKVKQRWRNTGSLRDSSPGVELRGGYDVEAAAGHPIPEVGCHPANGVVPQLGKDEGSYQFYELDHDKGPREVNIHGHGVGRGLIPIETHRYLVN